MMLRLRRCLWLATVCAWLFASSCDQISGCGARSDILATVITVNGGVLQLDTYAPPIAWQRIGLGAQARAGDALRTDRSATATVRLRDDSEVTLDPASLLRFRRAPGEGEPEFDLLSGDAYVQANRRALPLHTTVGVAQLEPGARVQLRRAGDTIHVTLQVGEATFRTVDGSDVVLAKGDTLKLEIGAAIMRETAKGLAEAVQRDPAVSSLKLEVMQAGVQVRAAGAKDYRELPPGTAALQSDTEITVAPGSRAVLRRADDTVELFGSGHYHVTAQGPLVSADSGSVRMQTKSQDILVVVPGGWIRARVADGGSEAKVEVSASNASVEVLRGNVSWSASASSEEKPVEPGQPLSWSLPGMDTMDTTLAAQANDNAPDNDRLAPGMDLSTTVGPAATEPNPSKRLVRASFTVPAGESFVVHAAKLPIAVGISLYSSCEGEAVVELNGTTRYSGSDVVNVLLDANSRTYVVRCIGGSNKPATKGRVRVLEDAGTRKLPPKPPTSNVDADGRSYTIYYQNQPPDIRIHWPNSPQVMGYQLDVDGEIRKLNSPEYTFPSGSLRDGQHLVTFAALSRRSRTTTLDIHFDNTATTASLNSPRDRGYTAGATVAIEGVVLPGWRVSVDGGTLEHVGRSTRFHGRIVTSKTKPDFAVRLSHPRLGTHYYLRRAAEAP